MMRTPAPSDDGRSDVGEVRLAVVGVPGVVRVHERGSGVEPEKRIVVDRIAAHGGGDSFVDHAEPVVRDDVRARTAGRVRADERVAAEGDLDAQPVAEPGGSRFVGPDEVPLDDGVDGPAVESLVRRWRR